MMHRVLVGCLIGSAALSVLAVSARAQPSSHAQHYPSEANSTIIRTPLSIAVEHRGLHEALERASKEPGALGRTARELETALLPHFRREEEIATPPLGLLPELARGAASVDMRAVLPMTDALERELPQMLREHETIRAAVTRFREAAESAVRPEYVRFSDDLAAHAREEEKILYPAAVLVGRYVALTTAPK